MTDAPEVLAYQLEELKKKNEELYRNIVELTLRVEGIEGHTLLSPSIWKRALVIVLYFLFGQFLIGLVFGAFYVLIVVIGALGSRTNSPILPTVGLIATAVIIQATPQLVRTAAPTMRVLSTPSLLPPAETPTSTPKPTKRPVAVQPTAKLSGAVNVTFVNNSGNGSRFVFWGGADKTIDVGPGQTSVVTFPAGSYGWTDFIDNGCKLNATDTLKISGPMTFVLSSDSSQCGVHLNWGP